MENSKSGADIIRELYWLFVAVLISTPGQSMGIYYGECYRYILIPPWYTRGPWSCCVSLGTPCRRSPPRAPWLVHIPPSSQPQIVVSLSSLNPIIDKMLHEAPCFRRVEQIQIQLCSNSRYFHPERVLACPLVVPTELLLFEEVA